MSWAFLIEIGLKTFVAAGVTLLLLRLFRGRSAAERSLVAHAGLAATLLLPLIVLAVPQWPVEAPEAIAWTEPLADQGFAPAPVPAADSTAAPDPVPAPADWPGSVPLPLLLYALPALALALTTLVAVLRLFAIRRRAAVLTDQSWLTALAFAQRRMGFKNGAALLTSAELASPVSWGLFRPTIVLNDAAVASPQEAEAIIAHELAHVVRSDWLKLLASRAATALFWFNPLVWMLARQCHQLREEAADDAVLRSEVKGVDYAALLVGAARHESRGMLLAANGVAPGRDSLKRRVARAIDSSLSRTPGGPGWRSGSAAGAMLLAAPLAALTPVPAAIPQAIATPPATQAPVPPSAPAIAAARAAEAAVTIARADAAADAAAEAVEARAPRAVVDLTDSVALPRFSSIKAAAGASIVLRPGTAWSARIPGGRIDPSRLRSDASGQLVVGPCTADCAGGGTVEIIVPSIGAIAVDGGGSVVAAAGFPRVASLPVAIRGGGTIDVRAIPVDAGVAAVTAGGTIRIEPRISLLASIRSGGDILYWGDPQVQSAVSHGGSVRRGAD